MKILSVCLFSLVILGDPVTVRTYGSPPEAFAPDANQSDDLDLLKIEYDRRRAEALRPVVAWYQSQLDLLGQKIEKEGQAVEEARAKLAATSWEDDQPELKRALLSQPWIWRSELDAEGVALKFLEDGSVHHVGLNGKWKITGPSEVTVQPDDEARYILRFNASLRRFVGDRRGVSGERDAAGK